MTDATSELSPGASSWERDLFAHMIQHVGNERKLLEAYVTTADATESKALAYVVKLLIEDERRHHILFQDLADSLRHDAEFRPGDPTIPRLDFDRVDRSTVRDLTDQLVQREQKDLRELKNLQRGMRNVKDTTLWSLLVDLMQRDTNKHIALLRFVQQHT